MGVTDDLTQRQWELLTDANAGDFVGRNSEYANLHDRGLLDFVSDEDSGGYFTLSCLGRAALFEKQRTTPPPTPGATE